MKKQKTVHVLTKPGHYSSMTLFCKVMARGAESRSVVSQVIYLFLSYHNRTLEFKPQKIHMQVTILFLFMWNNDLPSPHTCIKPVSSLYSVFTKEWCSFKS